MFELRFLSLFSLANFIFDIYYSTHTQEKDWQGFPFHFLIAFSEETFGRYVTRDYKLGLFSLSLKSYFSFKKHSSHAVKVSFTRTYFFCYANEMNILRAFLCGCFFRKIDSHEFLQNNIIMIQIYSPMRKSGQHYFWKFLTTSLSGGTLIFRWKMADRLRFMKLRKVKLPGRLYGQFRRSEQLLSLRNSLKMYRGSTLIVKRALNLKAILASWPTDEATL